MNHCKAAQIVKAPSLFRHCLSRCHKQNKSRKVVNNRKNIKVRPSIVNDSLCSGEYSLPSQLYYSTGCCDVTNCAVVSLKRDVM